MSGADDNFLARWSRRKQAVERAEQSEASEQPEPTHELVPPPSATAEEPAADEPPEPQPLPRIEDLTAESDLSAFLRAGVPQALKLAALRRAWSLDPAIRDYVGPAEYAYDFNDPASIPGFGSAGPDLPSLTQYVAHSNPMQDSAMPAGEPGQPDLDPVRRSSQADTRPPNNPPPSSAEPDAPDGSAEAAAGSPERADAGAPAPPAPRHGGAMPR